MDLVRAHVERLERALAESARHFVRIQLALDPACGARVVDIAGHLVVDGGRHAGANISRVYGLGLTPPLDAASLDAMMAFFVDDARRPRVFLTPFVDARTRALLASRGFTSLRDDVVLGRALDDGHTEPAPAGVVVTQATDADAWSRVVVSAFGAEHEGADTLRIRHAPFFAEPNATYVATAFGEPAGGAVLARAGDVAYLLADGTRDEHRGRGVQRALIAARLRDARAAGARFAYAITAPDVTSERNYLRMGFARVCVAEIAVRA